MHESKRSLIGTLAHPGTDGEIHGAKGPVFATAIIAGTMVSSPCVLYTSNQKQLKKHPSKEPKWFFHS